MEKPKIDLSSAVRKRAPRRYLIKIMIYAVVLIGLLIFAFSISNQPDEKETIIEDFQIEIQ